MKQSFEQVQNEYLWIDSEGSLIRTTEVGQKFNFYQNMPMRNVHMGICKGPQPLSNKSQ